MAQKRKRTSKTKGKQKAQGFEFKREYGALLLFVFSIFAIFAWGLVGIFASNLLRFFVGDLGIVLAVLLAFWAILLLMKKKVSDVLPFHYGLAIGGILINVLILLSLNAFANQASLFGEGFKGIWTNLSHNNQDLPVGGGLIGTGLAAIFVILFSSVGAYFLVVVSSLAILFVLSGKSLSDYADAFSSVMDRRMAKRAEKVESQKGREAAKGAELAKGADEKGKMGQKMADFADQVITEEDLEPVTFAEDYGDFKINAFEVDKKPEQLSTGQADKQHEAQPAVVSPSPAKPADGEEETSVSFSNPIENEHYELPPVSLLNNIEKADQSNEYDVIKRNSKILEETFRNFGVTVKIVAANLGPSVTKYELQPAVGVKVSKIVSLTDDIALALAAKDIRIEAPIPGKSLIGIEVPNQKTSMVSFREIIENNIQSPSKLEVPLGRDISGKIQMADLSKMPHLLVAGATGSGKSVAINGMITSILMKAKPHEVKLMMVDPKKVELNVYNGIPHLLTPVVTNPRRAAQALQKVVAEMERRYELFAETGMRNITGYNEHVEEYNQTVEEDKHMAKMPYIVVIVDELADLMMVASNEVEGAIIRLAQMARAAGIHMVLATQRPSVDVITGLIKANVPSRMAFAVSSSIDSRTIIDSNGAEKLLGKGDMLFLPMGESKPIRVQGAFLSDAEVERIVDFVKAQQGENYVEDMMPTGDLTPAGSSYGGDPEDELIHEVIAFLADQEFISASMLQRRFRVGFNRASRLMEDLETKGYVGPAEGTKPRKVLNPHVVAE